MPARDRRSLTTQICVVTLFQLPDRRSFQEVAKGWAEWIVDQVGAGTVKRYSVSLGQLAPFLEGKYLDEVDGALVASITKARLAKGASKATVKRDLVALSSVINFAIDETWTENNPVLPRLKRIKEKRDPIVLPRPEDVERSLPELRGCSS